MFAGRFAAASGATDFTPHGTQPGLFNALEEPNACSSCHGSASLPDATFMPHATWQGSLMANATRDPLFWAALDVAERDAPGVGDWCLRCHSPGGWLAGRVRKNGSGGLVNGTNGCLLQGDHDDPDFSDNDYSGVTCHMCHRMTPSGPAGQVAAQPHSGNFWIDDASSCGAKFGPCRYGPYSYTGQSPVTPPHPAQYSPFTIRSESCGTCHDVTSPLLGSGQPVKTLIVNGTNTGRAFPAERTFTEWQQSRYGDTLLLDSFEETDVAVPTTQRNVECQGCHLRKSIDPDAYACQMSPPGYRAGNLGVHEFVGGGVWVLRMLKGLYGAAGGSERLDAFDRTIAWTLDLLQQRSAQVLVTLDPWAGGTNALTARVRVTNLAGHKLPTGYPEGRRMWLHMTVRDATNATIFESGAWDPATGALASDAQLKVYETLQGVWDTMSSTCKTTDALGREQFHFALNDCIAKDNRIPPQGFRLAPAGDPRGVEFAPVGYVYPETAPGSGVLVNYDVTPYTVTVPPGAVPPLTVSAELKYQTSSKAYMEFLRDQAVDNAQPNENTMCARSPAWTVGPANKSRGQFAYDLWNGATYGKSAPVTMGNASAATP